MVSPPTMEAHGVVDTDTYTYPQTTPTYDESSSTPHHESPTPTLSAPTICELEHLHHEDTSALPTTPPSHERPNIPHPSESHTSHESDSCVSTTCVFESTLVEEVNAPPHILRVIFDRSRETILTTNNLPSTPVVFSSLVQGLIYGHPRLYVRSV